MTCAEATPLLSAERDRALVPRERLALERHLSSCVQCRQLRAGFAEAAESWRTTTAAVRVPHIEREWQTVRQRIRGGSATRHARSPAWARALRWSSLPLAAAAALAVVFWNGDRPPPLPTEPSAEFVESADARASTVVYVDEESGWLIVWASSPAA